VHRVKNKDVDNQTRAKSNSLTHMSNSLKLLNKRSTGEPEEIEKPPEEENEEGDEEPVFAGLILRNQLRVLLKHPKCFIKRDIFEEGPHETPNILDFREFLRTEEDLLFKKRKPGTDEAPLSEAELNMYIDLTHYVNASAMSVSEDTVLWVAYTMFLQLSLRHLVVLNVRGNVSGIITRHDLLAKNITRRAFPPKSSMSAEVAGFMKRLSIKTGQSQH
jgi:hypothetical protein